MNVDSFLELANILPEPMLLTTATGKILAANTAFCKLVGTTAGGMDGKGINSWIHEASQAFQSYLTLCSRKQQLIPAAFSLQLPGGEILPCKCEGGSIDSSAGPDSCRVAIRFRPKRDEAVQKEPPQVNAAPQNMDLVQEFNNILGAILMNVELARMDTPDASPVHESLDQMENGALRARDLVRKHLGGSVLTPTGVTISPSPSEGKSSGGHHILLVDDEESLLLVGRRLLERLGYKITTESNPKKALEIFQTNPRDFDLLITDQTMPGMTGLELAAALLKIRPDLPIILATGYTGRFLEEARNTPIRELMLKPFTMDLLAENVGKILGTQKAK